jgi:hypothetical protein
MTMNVIAITFAILVPFICVLALWLVGLRLIHYKNLTESLLDIRKKDTLVDLDLATNDQLLEAFRSRPNNPYIMLFPQKGFVSMEVHNLSPDMVASILQQMAGSFEGEFE